MAEEWKAVKGFPLYEVSNLGRVKSLQRIYGRTAHHGAIQSVVWKERIINGWLRRPRKDHSYSSVYVALRENGNTHQIKVAHLVLEAFVGPRPEGTEACHNDDNPRSNILSNLRWGTHKSNVADMWRNGRGSKPPIRYGERHHKATLSDIQVLEIRFSSLRHHGWIAQLARKYRTSETTIRRIVDGHTRTVKTR